MDFEEMYKLWENTTLNYLQAFQSWQQSLSSIANDTEKILVVWQEIMKNTQNLLCEISQHQPSETYIKHKNQQFFGIFQNIDQKTQQFLTNLTIDNFLLNFQKLAANSSKITDAKLAIDSWQAMLGEYLRDIEAIQEISNPIDMQKFLQFCTKITIEKHDPQAQKSSQRFFDSLKVKTKYGLEYYADPEKTQVGLTPHTIVWSKGKTKLLHYGNSTKQNSAPLLIIYSVINKPYILDLLPDNSLIEFFVKNQLDVYLLDWGEPEYSDRKISLDDLITQHIDEAIEYICLQNACSQVSLLGHCIGGVLASIYTALFPNKVSRLLTLTTPITADKGGVVGLWAYFLPVEHIINTFGNMPGKLLRYTFIGLKPYYEIMRWKKFYENIDRMSDQAIQMFYAIDKWVNDNVDVGGEIFRKFIQGVYQANGLCQKKMQIAGRLVDLSQIKSPLLNIVAKDDWIVTSKSAVVLNDLVSSEQKILREIPGQHLSILLHPENRCVWQEMLDFFIHPTSSEAQMKQTCSKKKEKTMRMENKVAVITGGSQGIGKATVLKFIAEGAKVAWCDLNEDANQQLLQEVGEPHSCAKVNVTDRQAVQTWIENVAERYGRIDVLVNNAGITKDNFLVKVKDGELVKQMPQEDFDAVINVNLKGVFNCTQAVVPFMIKQNHGVILSASSIVGTHGNIGQTNYAATKAGVVAMTQVWSRELGRYQIRANCISPGFISTPMVEKIPQKIIDQLAAKTPLQRMGKPEEIANTYLWLASDEASFITGANIPVDGGMVLGT